jgi:hypothetical protein
LWELKRSNGTANHHMSQDMIMDVMMQTYQIQMIGISTNQKKDQAFIPMSLCGDIMMVMMPVQTIKAVLVMGEMVMKEGDGMTHVMTQVMMMDKTIHSIMTHMITALMKKAEIRHTMMDLSMAACQWKVIQEIFVNLLLMHS